MKILWMLLILGISGCQLIEKQTISEDKLATDNCIRLLIESDSSLISKNNTLMKDYHRVRVVHYKDSIYSNLQFGVNDGEVKDKTLIDDSPSILCWVDRIDEFKVMQLTAPINHTEMKVIKYRVFDRKDLTKEKDRLMKRMAEGKQDFVTERLYDFINGEWVLDKEKSYQEI
ncbi:MAG: hypothetical protein JKY66_05175 [Spongiibacteraceae bacterium]|nr:hypothetical protein [Spongiibacteraceae bacterium]